MARVLSQTAILARRLGAQPRIGGALGLRHSHTRRPAAEAGDAGPSTKSDRAAAWAKKLEEAIDGALVRLSEPAWAPFRPGTSYFAPPRPAGAARGLLELINCGERIPLAVLRSGLSPDEARAVVSAIHSYPCSSYFIHGRFPDAAESSNPDAEQAQEE